MRRAYSPPIGCWALRWINTWILLEAQHCPLWSGVCSEIHLNRTWLLRQELNKIMVSFKKRKIKPRETLTWLFTCLLHIQHIYMKLSRQLIKPFQRKPNTEKMPFPTMIDSCSHGKKKKKITRVMCVQVKNKIERRFFKTYTLCIKVGIFFYIHCIYIFIYTACVFCYLLVWVKKNHITVE